MTTIETDFRIDYNPSYVKHNPITKGSLWLWSTERKYSEVTGEEIIGSGTKPHVSRSLSYLKILEKIETRPARLAIIKKAILMIHKGEVGAVPSV